MLDLTPIHRPLSKMAGGQRLKIAIERSEFAVRSAVKAEKRLASGGFPCFLVRFERKRAPQRKVLGGKELAQNASDGGRFEHRRPRKFARQDLPVPPF